MASLDSAESYVRQWTLVHVLVHTSPLLRIRDRRCWRYGSFKSAGIYHAVYVHLYRLSCSLFTSLSSIMQSIYISLVYHAVYVHLSRLSCSLFTSFSSIMQSIYISLVYHAVYVHLYRYLATSPSLPHIPSPHFLTRAPLLPCASPPPLTHSFAALSLTFPHHPPSLSHTHHSIPISHTLSHYLITSPSLSSSVTLPLIFPLPPALHLFTLR